MGSNVVTLPGIATKDRGAEIEAAIRVAFIQGLRRRAWTIEHAARECACSRQAICNYISGKNAVSARALFVVCGIGAANDAREAAA